MELVWYGAGCFLITERGYHSVVTDPFLEDNPRISLPNVTSEIVTSSRIMDEPRMAIWSGITGVIHTISGPGEYEIGGVFITGVESHTQQRKSKSSPDNVIYAIDYNGIVIGHLGECGSVPTQAQIEILGHINILLVPVGIPNGLSVIMASEIVSMIEPDMVIPTHYSLTRQNASYKSVNPFLKLMGIENPAVLPSLKIDNPVFPEGTQVILLEQGK
jgi:L-ascorbate metabolism protein UlaG (beta-lactamase superfamily)